MDFLSSSSGFTPSWHQRKQKSSISVLNGGQTYLPPETWNLTVETTGGGQDFSLIIAGTDPKIVINWGDGFEETVTSALTKNHVYVNPGIYIVKVKGSFSSGGNIRAGKSGNQHRVKKTDRICYFKGLTNFSSTFYGCSSLTSIPTDLFRYNTAVSTSGFNSTFAGCSKITSIPTDLFRYNTAVSTSGFQSTFYNCSSLTSIPTDLFRYNTAVSTSGFASTFYNCSKLQLTTDLFFAAGEESTRFLNRVSDFTNCFFIISFSGTQGIAPALWNCNFGTENPVKTTCFTGHSSSSLSNYNDIPAAWK